MILAEQLGANGQKLMRDSVALYSSACADAPTKVNLKVDTEEKI